MVAAATPVIRNVIVAAIERLEKRAIPRIPWPDVQPEPIRVPTPTRRPATMMIGQEATMVVAGKFPKRAA
jgi:hypothetical protein